MPAQGYPRYVIKPSLARVLVPEGIKTAFLCVLFYAGIWVNVFLLKMEIPDIVNWLIWAFLGMLLLLDIVLKWTKAKRMRAEVYTDRIIIHSEKDEDEVFWVQASPPEAEQNFIDKIFGTATIVIGYGRMRFVKNFEKIVPYLEQYRKYAVYYANYYRQQKAEGQAGSQA
ncbi:hypothetical protein D6764_05935 [Candidatus Woesearchaeota archaeon]|nr:MAG: hypothetical protein D6764_05935 [Candidatus Woesearchaeota archaeon]